MLSKRVIISLFFIYSISSLIGQQRVLYPLRIQKGSFEKDSIPYEIVDIIDQRDNPPLIGVAYGGILNLGYPVVVRQGLKKSLMNYFDKGFNNTKHGKKETLISINEFIFSHDGLEGKKRQEIHFKLDVDYYLVKNGNLKFVRNDKVDQLINSKFKLSTLEQPFTEFFKESLSNLEEDIKSEKYQSLTSTEKKENGIPFIENDKLVFKDPKKLTSLDSLPPERHLSRTHHLIIYENFYGNRTNGLRFRYLNFTRTWGNLDWKGAYSFDVEGFKLNESNDNFNVSYSYFAIGIGTIKPFSNYLFLELTSKIGLGNEIEDRGIFQESSKNSFFGFFLNQRLHLITDEKTGIVISAGIYQNFFPGAKYLNSDIGLSIGGGLKF